MSVLYHINGVAYGPAAKQPQKVEPQPSGVRKIYFYDAMLQYLLAHKALMCQPACVGMLPMRSFAYFFLLSFFGLAFQQALMACTDLKGCDPVPQSAVEPPVLAQDFDFVCLTVARDGSYGVGVDESFGTAISTAIQQCKIMAKGSSNCGSQLEISRGNWTIATLCGDQPVIVTSKLMQGNSWSMPR